MEWGTQSAHSNTEFRGGRIVSLRRVIIPLEEVNGLSDNYWGLEWQALKEAQIDGWSLIKFKHQGPPWWVLGAIERSGRRGKARPQSGSISRHRFLVTWQTDCKIRLQAFQSFLVILFHVLSKYLLSHLIFIQDFVFFVLSFRLLAQTRPAPRKKMK